MSRAVYMMCMECNSPSTRDYSDSVNHGEAQLRLLWSTRELVQGLHGTGAWGDPDPEFGRGNFFRFIAAHSGHRVVLRDEYGGTGLMAGTGDCVR